MGPSLQMMGETSSRCCMTVGNFFRAADKLLVMPYKIILGTSITIVLRLGTLRTLALKQLVRSEA